MEYKYEALDTSGSWIFIITDDEWDYEEPDAFIYMMKTIKERVNGKIIALENDSYRIEGTDVDLIYQWDSCFGITVVCPKFVTRECALEYLTCIGILNNERFGNSKDNRYCNIGNKIISSEVCYEIQMCLFGGIAPASVPEVDFSRNEETVCLCEGCCFNGLE